MVSRCHHLWITPCFKRFQDPQHCRQDFMNYLPGPLWWCTLTSFYGPWCVYSLGWVPPMHWFATDFRNPTKCCFSFLGTSKLMMSGSFHPTWAFNDPLAGSRSCWLGVTEAEHQTWFATVKRYSSLFIILYQKYPVSTNIHHDFVEPTTGKHDLKEQNTMNLVTLLISKHYEVLSTLWLTILYTHEYP